MAPPQLAADAPIPNVAHPMRIGFAPSLGMESDALVLDSFGGGLETGIFQKPLLAQIRLDRHLTTLAVADAVDVILGFEKQALLRQLLDHGLARFHAVHAVKILAGFLGHGTVGSDH